MMRGSKCLLSLYIVFTLPCWNPGARIKMGKVNMFQFVQMVRFRAVSLCCAPETITALSISSTSVQNKKVFKKW